MGMSLWLLIKCVPEIRFQIMDLNGCGGAKRAAGPVPHHLGMIPPPPPSYLDRVRPYLRPLVDNVLMKVLTAFCPPLLCLYLIAIYTIRKSKEPKECVDEVAAILNGSFSVNSTALLGRLSNYSMLLREIGTSQYVFVIARFCFVLLEWFCLIGKKTKKTTRIFLRCFSSGFTFFFGALFWYSEHASIDDDFITRTNMLYVVLLCHSIMTFDSYQDLLEFVHLILATFAAFVSEDSLTPDSEYIITSTLSAFAILVGLVHIIFCFIGEEVEDVDELKRKHKTEVDGIKLERDTIVLEREATAAENERLTQQIEDFRRENTELKQSIFLKDQEKRELMKKLEELARENREVKESIALKDGDMNRLKVMLRDEEIKANDLQLRVDEQRKVLDQSQKRVSELEADAVSTATHVRNMEEVAAEQFNQMVRIQEQLQGKDARVAQLEMERKAAEDLANGLLVDRNQLIVDNGEQAAQIVQLQNQMMQASTSAADQMNEMLEDLDKLPRD